MSIAYTYRHRCRIVWGMSLALLMLLATGCMGGYGRFATNTQVGQAFRSGEAQSGYRYYYTGRDSMPYAIIGIDSTYSVPSRYWIPFEPEPQKLSKMSDNMYGKMGYAPTGAHILDPAGSIIGVWFSSLYTSSVRVDAQRRTVEILYRNPENARSLSVGVLDGMR